MWKPSPGPQAIAGKVERNVLEERICLLDLPDHGALLGGNRSAQKRNRTPVSSRAIHLPTQGSTLLRNFDDLPSLPGLIKSGCSRPWASVFSVMARPRSVGPSVTSEFWAQVSHRVVKVNVPFSSFVTLVGIRYRRTNSSGFSTYSRSISTTLPRPF